MPPTLVVNNSHSPPEQAGAAEPQSFAEHPVTAGETRAKAKGSTGWTPREMLVSLLRQIDQGEIDIEKLVIISQEVVDDDGQSLAIYLSGPASNEAIGMIARAKFNLLCGTTVSVVDE